MSTPPIIRLSEPIRRTTSEFMAREQANPIAENPRMYQPVFDISPARILGDWTADVSQAAAYAPATTATMPSTARIIATRDGPMRRALLRRPKTQATTNRRAASPHKKMEVAREYRTRACPSTSKYTAFASLGSPEA